LAPTCARAINILSLLGHRADARPSTARLRSAQPTRYYRTSSTMLNLVAAAAGRSAGAVTETGEFVCGYYCLAPISLHLDFQYSPTSIYTCVKKNLSIRSSYSRASMLLRYAQWASRAAATCCQAGARLGARRRTTQTAQNVDFSHFQLSEADI
jgi:hypothetical protein